MRLRTLSFVQSIFGVAILLFGVSLASAEKPTASKKAFVEGGLAYGYQMSTSDFIEVDSGSRLEGPGSSGVAIDVTGGYSIMPNLFIVGDLQHAWASTIIGEDDNRRNDQLSFSYTSLTVGLRTEVPAGPGKVYAQMSVGFVFPFETVHDEERDNGESRITTIGYNSGLGGRGEMGYHYDLTDRMYLAGGVRLQAFATDNVGRERVREDLPNGDIEREEYSTDPNANNARDAEALSLQGMRLRIGFGYRF